MNGGGLRKRKERMCTTSPLVLGNLLQMAMPYPVTGKGTQERAQERKGSKEHLWHLQSSLFLQRCFNPLILRKFPYNSVFPAWLHHGAKLWKVWLHSQEPKPYFSYEALDLLLKAFPSMWEKFPVNDNGCSSNHLCLCWADSKAHPSPWGPFSGHVVYRL